MTAQEQLQALEKRIRDQERWAAGHDGRINAKWEAQDNLNDKCDSELRHLHGMATDKFTQVFNKLNALEIKVATFAALAAGGGAAAAKYLLP
jgi:hypothetical protein